MIVFTQNIPKPQIMPSKAFFHFQDTNKHIYCLYLNLGFGYLIWVSINGLASARSLVGSSRNEKRRIKSLRRQRQKRRLLVPSGLASELLEQPQHILVENPGNGPG